MNRRAVVAVATGATLFCASVVYALPTVGEGALARGQGREEGEGGKLQTHVRSF